ncbi:sigma-54-dependent transcriptional regulator [Desulfobacula phenolica]|uniref:DNA-binding transcriptional response regulator, NtrC family, contains REC, AAA-type ATPase, and a Fis-type DNA-binding domains n=1 Tax=Desulfobacula phenolica TaxID=90732 RepID=A0A1H2DZ86_9BACT|nr:sigma-54 dependent transcriptional regulator [Desulfobacula phenolica]SDT88109.1 DNA-binding transcriptional response regulator, NtrC family, contains REC, AAA-type ATPase, and a Fis-type DNA-binding domains [Desulfobacula phenolica]
MANRQHTLDRPIFIVDDEPEILLAVDTCLRMAGMDNIITISDARDVIRQMERQIPCLMILDLNMPHINGRRLLQIIRKTYPRIPVIILTGAIDVDTAVNCMKIGAMDYVVKPVEEKRLLAAVKQALALINLENKAKVTLPTELFAQIKNPKAFAHIITQDEKMHSIFHYIEAIAPSSQPVLVFGETGVGKELIGQSIHELSQRKGKLVVVNVAGLDDNIFSDTLFGHVTGAFTGAQTSRPGLIEQAAGGTLFLDEIGDLALTSQVKLLRLLQEREYLPLGSDKTRQSDARVVAATNRDLWNLERKGVFRKDLIYRLSTHTLTLPPLRDRLLDLPLLLDRFICQAANELDKPVPELPKILIEQMETYPFKGNIRELKSMVYDAISRYRKGPMTADLFKGLGLAGSGVFGSSSFCSGETVSGSFESGAGPDKDSSVSLPTLKEASRELVEKAMKQTGGNQSAAAGILGISQQALSKRLKKLKQEQDKN